MSGMRTPALLLSLHVGLAGCASESSDAVQHELIELSARAAEGVRQIERGLADPDLASHELGAGVQAVEVATRNMAVLEIDSRASDVQQLMAVVHQARAWDDAARAILAGDVADLDASQQQVLATVLEEKAFPAKVAAENAYERALRKACRAGIEDLPVVLEILDGIDRYGGDAPPADQPCDRP